MFRENFREGLLNGTITPGLGEMDDELRTVHLFATDSSVKYPYLILVESIQTLGHSGHIFMTLDNRYGVLI